MKRTSTAVEATAPTRRKRCDVEQAQQLGLQGQFHLADLVKEHRAVVRRLDQAQLAFDRAGEGALLVAEELQIPAGSTGIAAQLMSMNSRPCPARLLVDHPRHQPLAGAGLAIDQHGARRADRHPPRPAASGPESTDGRPPDHAGRLGHAVAGLIAGSARGPVDLPASGAGIAVAEGQTSRAYSEKIAVESVWRAVGFAMLAQRRRAGRRRGSAISAAAASARLQARPGSWPAGTPRRVRRVAGDPVAVGQQRLVGQLRSR